MLVDIVLKFDHCSKQAIHEGAIQTPIDRRILCMQSPLLPQIFGMCSGTIPPERKHSRHIIVAASADAAEIHRVLNEACKRHFDRNFGVLVGYRLACEHQLDHGTNAPGTADSN